MKFFRIDLLTLLISLFILSSCKNQDGIGLTPGQQLSGTLLVDTNIVVNTTYEDSVYTNSLPKTPLGYFNDPQIGITESNIAMAISLPGASAYTIPTGTITIDSAILVLRYAAGFYGDSLTSKYKINVYQLAEKPLSTIAYYNTKAWSVSSTLVGSKAFNARPNSSFKITDIVTAAKDTLKSVPAQLRVPLNPAFFQNNLFNASSSALASNTVFQDAVKGLYLTMDKTQTGPGGTFSLAVDSSSIAVYYKTNDGAGTIDTAIVSLPIGARAAQIKHTYTAAVQAVINNQAASNNTFYIQGAAGLRAKISFPGLSNIMAQAGGSIVINRAELVITPVSGSTIPFPAQSKISMYQLDNTKQRIELQDATSTDLRYLSVGTFGGYFTTSYDYHFIITGYIQDLMLGKTVDYGTYIGAVDNTNTSTVDYLATPQTLGRLVAVGSLTNKASADYPYRIKLNLIYTKVNK